jgi:hypothetical protein
MNSPLGSVTAGSEAPPSHPRLHPADIAYGANKMESARSATPVGTSGVGPD